jgi:CheY-like chemotaxis protein
VLPACPNPAAVLCSNRQGGGVVTLWCGEPSPTTKLAPAPASQTAPTAQQDPAGKPGILVVDDEPLLLTVLESGLRAHGFTVWVAANGWQAQEVYRSHLKEIAVILLDVRMPGMDGPQTLAALRQVNPAVRCCFMTGNMGLYTPEDLLALGAVQIFPKPFDLPQMAEALWQLAAHCPGDAAVVSGSPPHSLTGG